MARKAAKKKASKNISIESALEELDLIVTELENGQGELDQSIERFERGMLLLKECHQQLDAAARRIEVVTKVDEDGNIQTTPFDDISTEQKKAVQLNDTQDNASGTSFD